MVRPAVTSPRFNLVFTRRPRRNVEAWDRKASLDADGLCDRRGVTEPFTCSVVAGTTHLYADAVLRADMAGRGTRPAPAKSRHGVRLDEPLEHR